MQPTDVISQNQILEEETSPPRRRQKVRVRPGPGQVKASPTSPTSPISTVSTSSINTNSFSSRRISVARFKPRKEVDVKFGEISSHSSSDKRKVVGRHRMRRPPSIRSQERPQRGRKWGSPSAVMKSIKRMRIRARDRTPQRTTPIVPSSPRPPPLGTTEIITISPDAHKIRFTLDTNEVTSELPILTHGPSASKRVSTFLVPDDVFR